GQDLDGAVDALPAACHQAVEVGAADQGEPGPEGDGRHDVGAVHDAGVDADLGVRSDFTRDLGQQVEGDRGAVQLPPAVIGQDDPVDPVGGEGLGVLEALDSLYDQLAGQQLPDALQVLVDDRRIQCRVQQDIHGDASQRTR